MDARSWRQRMEELLAALRHTDLGYDQGDNVLLPGAPMESLAELAGRTGLRPSASLLSFYEWCGGVQLPDVWNGYFIHGPELVLRTHSQDGPRHITGPHARTVLFFGSDGGGGSFLLSTNGSDEILHVAEGALHDGIMDGMSARLVAADLGSFLQRLLADTEAFVEGREDWTYMV